MKRNVLFNLVVHNVLEAQAEKISISIYLCKILNRIEVMDSFRLRATSKLCSPITEHVLSHDNHYVKIMHMLLGGANNMHPLSLGTQTEKIRNICSKSPGTSRQNQNSMKRNADHELCKQTITQCLLIRTILSCKLIFRKKH